MVRGYTSTRVIADRLVLFRNQPLSLFVFKLHILPLALLIHKGHQSDTDYKAPNRKGNVDRDGVVVEGTMGQCVQPVLGEIHQSGETDDCSVDTTESRKAEYFGSIVTVPLVNQCSTSKGGKR